ncbi:hypothetical protein EC844_11314 [Acinetobacter calcoaceticus]|uniref:Uncharacterized protein n=1 Tax=Acinetobacter calcoaceticus TaxID=471 RepID=A0A4R1XQA7_ACICA|nr:hypothetical protein EC844_11314 [Acinetobacter calcoaceticus]
MLAIDQYLKLSRYILGICSILLGIAGIGFIIFMPPLWFALPLFGYLIFLNFKQPKRILDRFDLIQICVLLIILFPHEYFAIINLVFLVFILYKIYKKQFIRCNPMLGFCIVFMITKDVIALSILILLCLFSALFDMRLNHKISSTSQPE